MHLTLGSTNTSNVEPCRVGHVCQIRHDSSIF